LPPRRSLVLVSLLLGLVSGGPGSAHAQPEARRPSVDLGLGYTGEVVGVVAGGVERGAVYLDNLDATLTLRSNGVGGWRGGTAFVYGLGNQGGAPSALVGDVQATSNIEAPVAWQIYELWLQQTVAGRGASLLVGWYDLNSEFDVNGTGAVFLHSSHGTGAALGLSGRNGPSIFPAAALGARLKVRLGPRAYAQAAALDGVLGAFEAGVLVGAPDGPAVDRTRPADARAKLAVGAWAYSTPLRDWTTVHAAGGAPQRARGSWGVYGLAEGRLWSEADRAQGLGAFVRLGWAEARLTRIARYVGAGLAYTGLVPGRDADRAGLAVAAAFNGGAYRRAQRRAGRAVTAAEVAVEGVYAVAVTDWLAVQGDVQVVVHPGTDPDVPVALVPALRVTATR
jgi:porin